MGAETTETTETTETAETAETAETTETTETTETKETTETTETTETAEGIFDTQFRCRLFRLCCLFRPQKKTQKSQRLLTITNY